MLKNHLYYRETLRNYIGRGMPLQSFILKHFIRDPQFMLEKINKSKTASKLFNNLVNFLGKLGFASSLYTFTENGEIIKATNLFDPEPQVKRYFTPKPNDVIIDVGAYIGNFTLKTKGKIGKNGLIIAVEPHPRSYSLLLRNLELNGIKAETFNMALADYNGECQLASMGRMGLHTIMVTKESSLTVPCRTLDSLLRENGVSHVDWIKVDVEGAEYRVLQGMKETLQNNQEVKCVFEIHNKCREARLVEPSLRGMGFAVTKIDHIHILASRGD